MPSFASIDRQGIETQRGAFAPDYNAATDSYRDLTQWLENQLFNDWAASFDNPHGLSRDELKSAIAGEIATLAPRYKADFGVDDAQFAIDFKAKLTTLFESSLTAPISFPQLFSPLVYDNPATTDVETVPNAVTNLAVAVAPNIGVSADNGLNTLEAALTSLRDDAVQIGISTAAFDNQARNLAARADVTSLAGFVSGMQEYISSTLFTAPSTTGAQVRAKYQKLADLSFSPVSLSTKIADQLGNDLYVLMQESGNLYKDAKAGTRYSAVELTNFKKEIETFAGRLVAEASRDHIDIGGVAATLMGRMAKFTSASFNGNDIKALAVGTVFSERLDERVIFAYKNRALSTSDKRDQVKKELEGQTAIVKAYSAVQSLLNEHLANGLATKESDSITYKDLGFATQDAFINSPDYKVLNDKFGISVFNFPGIGETHYITLKSFGNAEGITIPKVISEANDGKDEWRKRTSELATTISNKSKSYSDEVNLKTTELNDVSNRYNSAIEALNKFVQKYNSILQEILRAI